MRSERTTFSTEMSCGRTTPRTRMYSSPLLRVSFFCPWISRLPPGRMRTTETDIRPVSEFDCAAPPVPENACSLPPARPSSVSAPEMVESGAPRIGGSVTEYSEVFEVDAFWFLVAWKRSVKATVRMSPTWRARWLPETMPAWFGA